MSDIHALPGAYAVDALDDIERAQFEQHLAECAECRAEVAASARPAALLAETTVDDAAGLAARPRPRRDRARCGRCRRAPAGGDAAPAAARGGAAGCARLCRRGRRRGRCSAPAVLVWHPWHRRADQPDLPPPTGSCNAPDAVTVTEQAAGRRRGRPSSPRSR